MKKWEISKKNQKIIDELGIEIEWDDREDDNGDIQSVLSIWTPVGKVFNSTGCHCDCSIGDNKTLTEVLNGMYDCDDPDCDYCHPIEIPDYYNPED